MVLDSSEKTPIAVFSVPLVFALSDNQPAAVLLEPDELL